jgi:hypothetical protein
MIAYMEIEQVVSATGSTTICSTNAAYLKISPQFNPVCLRAFTCMARIVLVLKLEVMTFKPLSKVPPLNFSLVFPSTVRHVVVLGNDIAMGD